MNQRNRYIIILTTVALMTLCIHAQDGNAGINDANTQVRSYFDAGTNLMYAVGAIVRLIGAVKVYQKWNSIYVSLLKLWNAQHSLGYHGNIYFRLLESVC